jgi:hypothetical protein
MKMLMLVFWVATPCGLVVDINVLQEHTASIFNPEDGASMSLGNIYIYLQIHMALLPKKPTSTGITLNKQKDLSEICPSLQM